MNDVCFPFALAASILSVSLAAAAEEPASIAAAGNVWTLRNDVLQATVSFVEGKLRMDGFWNRAAHVDYLKGQAGAPLFAHRIRGAAVAADDGGWTLDRAETRDIELYGRSWGKRLEITLSRTQPAAFSTRQIFEIYDGRAALRCGSYLKNGTDKELTIDASDVLGLNLPDRPHTLAFVERIFTWRQTRGGLRRGGRNGIVRYDSGDGWFCVPENNWATSLVEGQNTGDPQEKFLGLDIFPQGCGLRVATNPKAVRLTLFPREEIEWFSVDLGVFSGDMLDGRTAVAEHLRRRFKFHDPSPVLSVNDYRWPQKWNDAACRNIVIPKVAAAGFDSVHFDAEWYAEDGTDAANHWTDMASLCAAIVARGMTPGHWFPLQGKGGSCGLCWYDGHGRDAADPANIDFKLKQTEDVLIGKYHSAWGQLDCGLLWRTDKPTAYSHPGDSVYRKLLGMRRYINAVTHKHPDYLMHITCEIDNPGLTWCAQNEGLAHLGDNAVIGSFKRTEADDDVRDLFASFGLFPLEGELSTWGEDQNIADAWRDSPLWYYQFLLARHTSVYSWPGDWWAESIAHLRAFNDWRKNPRIQRVLNQLARPVYNGPDWIKNEGPWCWSFIDAAGGRALVFAVNHRELNANNSFAAKLRGLDEGKSYLIEEITQQPDGSCNYRFHGEFTGAELKERGLPVDLDVNEEPCAAFWLQEKTADKAQTLYADAAVTRCREKAADSGLAVMLEGAAGATAQLVVYKPSSRGVEYRQVALDASGKATAVFDETTISPAARPRKLVAATAAFAARDTAAAGAWRGKYGAKAAWIAGGSLAPAGGFTMRTRLAATHQWREDDKTERVLALPAGRSGKKLAACWTAVNAFSLVVGAPGNKPYRLTVYLMDYDIRPGQERGIKLTVKTRNGKALDVRRAAPAETAKGVYLTWTVTGSVIVEAAKTEGINAAVSGVFVD